MHDRLAYPFDPEYIISNRRKIRRELLADGTQRVKKRVALLGGTTTGILKPVLELFLLNFGVEPEFYESEYNRFWQDAMFGSPELDGFRPEIVYIHTSNRNISSYPKMTDSAEDVKAMLDSEISRYREMWDALTARYNCVIIQNNFELPSERLLANLDFADHRGKVNYINRMNAALAEYASGRTGFYINDINYLSAVCGLDRWNSREEWYLYKLSPATSCVPALCCSVASIIKAICGRNKKMLVLDLDNTLWGGVVGDVGKAGLELGEESATGEAYREFQKYVKDLSSTGVVLGIASKNDEENALDGLTHPDGYLHAEDFAAIRANWDRKDVNIIGMVSDLSLLPDSVVFADDNPAERLMVKEGVKGAAVPEMTSPDTYISAIDRGGYFEPLTISGDDINRNAMYRENAKRTELEHSFTDYNEYLKSLDMHAQIGSYPEIYIKRVAQLSNKSNQFNLTTLRLTENEVAEMASSPEYITLCGKLSDRFGDNGIVSVMAAKINGDTADIILFLMSCRVLKRGMEHTMRNELIRTARERGIKTLVGHYYPTAKNAMVKDLYTELGFDLVSRDDDGTGEWRIDTGAADMIKTEILVEDFPENDRK